MTLRFSPNLSLLWSALPLPERFERAAAAGFCAVELWWPGPRDAELLPELTKRHGLRLAALNFDAGDMAAGDRGLMADPARRDQFRANVPDALRIARACGCGKLNALVGLRQQPYPRELQLDCALDNVTWAADQAAAMGCSLLIEAVNPIENGPYLLTTTEAAADFIGHAGRENIRLLYDAYHMQRMEGDLTTTVDTYWPLIGHIQIADVPGRGEPGTGEINYRFLLDHLDRRGYDGYIGLEYRPSGGSPEESFGWLEEFGLPREPKGAPLSGLRSDDRGTREQRRGKASNPSARPASQRAAPPSGLRSEAVFAERRGKTADSGGPEASGESTASGVTA